MHQSIESLGGGGGAGTCGDTAQEKINKQHSSPLAGTNSVAVCPTPGACLNKNTQVPKISTFYFVKINHKNLSSYITNNKTFSSYKNKILDLEKTPFTLLFIKHLTSIIKHLQHHVTVKILLLCTHSPAPGSPPGEGPQLVNTVDLAQAGVRPADRPTGIVAAKYDVTIQIPRLSCTATTDSNKSQ